MEISSAFSCNTEWASWRKGSEKKKLNRIEWLQSTNKVMYSTSAHYLLDIISISYLNQPHCSKLGKTRSVEHVDGAGQIHGDMVSSCENVLCQLISI